MPFVTAATLVHGAPSLRLFNDALLVDPQVHALAARIQIQPGLPDRAGHPPARLQAWLAGSGEGLRAEADGVDAPVEGDIRVKFLACAQSSGTSARAWSCGGR